MAELVSLYGPYLALLLVGLGWLGKNVWPVLVRRDEQEREERREERNQLIELVKNNTAVMSEVKEVVRQNTRATEFLSRDVAHIYAQLNLPRPARPGEEHKD